MSEANTPSGTPMVLAYKALELHFGVGASAKSPTVTLSANRQLVNDFGGCGVTVVIAWLRQRGAPKRANRLRAGIRVRITKVRDPTGTIRPSRLTVGSNSASVRRRLAPKQRKNTVEHGCAIASAKRQRVVTVASMERPTLADPHVAEHSPSAPET